MKAMAALDTIIEFLCGGFPTGWAKKVQPLATSSAECRVWPILELALGTDHARKSFPLRVLSIDFILRGISHFNYCGIL
jgi:hypothetical protein